MCSEKSTKRWTGIFGNKNSTKQNLCQNVMRIKLVSRHWFNLSSFADIEPLVLPMKLLQG